MAPFLPDFCLSFGPIPGKVKERSLRLFSKIPILFPPSLRFELPEFLPCLQMLAGESHPIDIASKIENQYRDVTFNSKVLEYKKL